METFVKVALQNAALGAALAVAVFLLTRIFRHPRVVHALWLLVLIKLVTPPLFTIPIRVGGWGTEFPVETATEAPSSVVGETFPTGAGEIYSGQASATLAASKWSWWEVLFWVWLTGFLLWLVIAAHRIRRFHRLIKTTHLTSPGIQAVAEKVAERMGLRSSFAVWLVDARISPVVWPVGWKPRILLPSSFLSGMDDTQLQLVLAHELSHIKRRDYLVRWLEMVVIGFFWWNPAAWRARRNLRIAEEQCCDAMVLDTFRPETHTYAETLLQMVNCLAGNGVSSPSLASGIGSRGSLIRRCEMILNQPKRYRLGKLTVLSIFTVGLCVLPLSTQIRGQTSDDHLQQAKPSTRNLEERIERLEKLMKSLLKQRAGSSRQVLGRTAGFGSQTPRKTGGSAPKTKAKPKVTKTGLAGGVGAAPPKATKFGAGLGGATGGIGGLGRAPSKQGPKKSQIAFGQSFGQSGLGSAVKPDRSLQSLTKRLDRIERLLERLVQQRLDGEDLKLKKMDDELRKKKDDVRRRGNGKFPPETPF